VEFDGGEVPTEATIGTPVEYALAVEDAVGPHGHVLYGKSGVGGSHSVKLTVANFQRIVDRNVERVDQAPAGADALMISHAEIQLALRAKLAEVVIARTRPVSLSATLKATRARSPARRASPPSSATDSCGAWRSPPPGSPSLGTTASPSSPMSRPGCSRRGAW
jgi:hypothetical protein